MSTMNELQAQVDYYRNVVIPAMQAREAIMTREWGTLWHNITSENTRLMNAYGDNSYVTSLQAENERLRRENAARIQNQCDMSNYASTLEKRCEMLEKIDADRSKSVWRNASQRKQ